MKKILILIIGLVQFTTMTAFAGGSGGGGVMAAVRAEFLAKGSSGSINLSSMKQSSPEILFTIAESNDSVQFAYGKLESNKWSIKKFQVLKSELQNDETILKALNDSKTSNSWVDVDSKF